MPGMLGDPNLSKDGEGVESIVLHHCMPESYGELSYDDILPPLILLPVDLEVARRPVNPGMPPLFYPPLPLPEAFQLIVPQCPPRPPERKPAISYERVAFPVPRSPDFQPSATPPAEDAATGSALPGGASTAAAASMAEAVSKRPRRPSWLEQIDPLYAYLLYLALGLGTLYLQDVAARQTILWTALLVLGGLLTLVDTDMSHGMTSGSLAWGLGIGAVIGLPLFILAGPGLAATAAALYPDLDSGALFQALIFVGPLGETFFFRGVLQDRRGIGISILGAGLGYIIFYLPALAAGTPVYLIAAVFFFTVMAGVYSYVRNRYGLAAALLCQSAANLMLMFLPRILV